MSDTLSAEDKRIIKDFSDKMDYALDSLDKAKQLKVGDYLVLYCADHEGKMQLKKNTYGAPIKFQVMFTSKHGIPFIKPISSAGNPVGHLMSTIGNLDTDTFRHPTQRFQFELDPDYADALLLQDENFDPSQLHKNKHNIWKEVTKHNKTHKVRTKEIPTIVDFFKTLNIGDTIWTSTTNHYVVQDKKTISKADAQKIVKFMPYNRVKGPFVIVLTLIDKKGKVKEVAADFFHYKALYKERPRSYKELNI